jgi:hypothetical protein
MREPTSAEHYREAAEHHRQAATHFEEAATLYESNELVSAAQAAEKGQLHQTAAQAEAVRAAQSRSFHPPASAE